MWQTARGKGVSIQGTPDAWTSGAEPDIESLSTKDHSLGLDVVLDLGGTTHQACPTE